MTSGFAGTSRSLKHLAALALLSLLFPSYAHAGAVTLTWSANPEPDIAGYLVSYGTTSGGYIASVDVGNYTTFQFGDALAGQTYYFAIRAYNTAGMQSSYSQEVSYSQVSNLAITSLTANLPSPQPPDSLITFSVSALGGIAPYQYRWLLTSAAGTQVLQEWSTAGSFSWKPAATGSYTISAAVRSMTTMTEFVATQNIPFTISGSRLAAQPLQSSMQSPQGVNTTITFTAGASGGTAPYQYKWFIQKDGTWQVARDWSSSNWWNWTPTTTGSYEVGVWVRSSGSSVTNGPENGASSTMPFSITGSFVRLTGVTSDLRSPQPLGSSILFTAWSEGATSPQYRWFVSDGSSWVLAQDWSASPNFLLTPSKPGSKQVLVRVRDGSGTGREVDSLTTLTTTFGITGGASDKPRRDR